LLALWRYYNLHLARVMQAMPEEQRLRPRHPDMLAGASWRRIPEDQPATLEDLVLDCVGHVKHHLGKLLLLYSEQRDVHSA
jgi:hypothetical protein